jgi:tetratricopeptide (TPR) repeat protein
VREVEVRAGEHPPTPTDSASGPSDDPSNAGGFDPREVVDGAVASQFAARLAGAERQAGGAASAANGARGLERFSARDYPTAIAAFQAVLAADEQNAAAAFLLGWAYYGARDDRQAISAWRRAAFIDPTLVSAHLALADTYVRLSQPSLAIQALRAGLNALPDSPELLDRLARIEQARR